MVTADDLETRLIAIDDRINGRDSVTQFSFTQESQFGDFYHVAYAGDAVPAQLRTLLDHHATETEFITAQRELQLKCMIFHE